MLEFEEKIAAYAHRKFAVAVNSGTSGLHLVVRAIGLGVGDEVITTPFSFIASSNCLLYENVKPVFVDIEADTYNIDPQRIEAAITPRTRAILAVDVFGQPARYDVIQSIAGKHNLKVISDCCESIGAEYKGKRASAYGVAGVFLLIAIFFRRLSWAILVSLSLAMALCWTFGVTYLVIGELNTITGFMVVILFGLPWLDQSPARSMRYRPGWHFWLLIVFAVALPLGIVLSAAVAWGYWWMGRRRPA